MINKTGMNSIGMWSALKGLLVLQVVLVHTIYDSVSVCEESFPIAFRILLKFNGIVLLTFFMINGFLFKENKKLQKIKQQYTEYLKIYGAALLAMTVAKLLNNILYQKAFMEDVFFVLAGGLYGATNETCVLGYQLPLPMAMWFFMALMNANLLLEVETRIKNAKMRNALLWGIPAVFFVASFILGETARVFSCQLPFYPVQTAVGTCALYLGLQIRKHNLLVNLTKKQLMGLAFLALFTYIFGQTDIGVNHYRLNALDLIGVLCGTVLILYGYVHLVNPDWKLVQIFMWLGRRSLWIIPLHSIEMVLIDWFDMRWLAPSGIYGTTIFICVIRLILILVACIGIEKVQFWIRLTKNKKYASI